MSIATEAMPTELIWKDPNRMMHLRIVNSKEYKELMALYTDTLRTLDMCVETMEMQDQYIEELEESRRLVDTDPFYTDDDYEPGVLKMNIKPEKTEVIRPKTKRKFAGATLEFDPFRKSFGIGLHFKTVTKN